MYQQQSMYANAIISRPLAEVSFKYMEERSERNNPAGQSWLDVCQQKAIIDHIIKLANRWLPEVATLTLIGVLRFCRAWRVYL